MRHLRCRGRYADSVLPVVALCLLAVTPWAGLLPRADSAVVTVPVDVRDAIARAGSVRVIVELRLPGGRHMPERLLSPTGAANQRSDIAAAQARVLARLSSSSHRLVHRYASIPMMALQNGSGVWDTTAPNGNWLLGVASTLDGGLLNSATMAVNVAVADGGSLVLFASDYGGGQAFLPGRTLTILATLSDGTSAQATTTVSTAVTVTAVTPNTGTSGATVPVTIDGSGFVSGTSVNAGAGITVTNVALVSSTRLTATFTVAGTATAGARDVAVINPSGIGATLIRGFTVTSPMTLTLTYNGKLRDRVGAGDTARTGDGASDGTLTLTLSAAGGRTVTALRLQNGYGVWDTTSPNAHWLLGVASTLDSTLLNNATTMVVNVAVADGGSLVLFASDYGGGQAFLPGRTLTILATFSDGTASSRSVVVP